MKVKVTLVGLQSRNKKRFAETVVAVDYQDARQVALARNPGAKTVVSVTADFFNGILKTICSPLYLGKDQSFTYEWSIHILVCLQKV